MAASNEPIGAGTVTAGTIADGGPIRAPRVFKAWEKAERQLFVTGGSAAKICHSEEGENFLTQKQKQLLVLVALRMLLCRAPWIR